MCRELGPETASTKIKVFFFFNYIFYNQKLGNASFPLASSPSPNITSARFLEAEPKILRGWGPWWKQNLLSILYLSILKHTCRQTNDEFTSSGLMIS